MRCLEFNFPLKVSPFDFIVKEVAEYPDGDNFFLYLLVKRNLSSNDPYIVSFLKSLGVKVYGYAGLKDRNALTVQHVSLDTYIGRRFVKRDLGRYFALLFLKKIPFKIKTGYLRGNLFFINHRSRLFTTLPYSVNYYDKQRLGKNVARGRKTLKGKTVKKKWETLFWINSYQSFIWNLAATELLLRRIEAFNAKRGVSFIEPVCVKEGKVKLVFPYSRDREALKEFLKGLEGLKIPLPGYKVDYSSEGGKVVRKLLEGDEISPEDFKRWGLKGDYRPLVVKVDKIRRYPSSLRFFLPKGSFATAYIKQLWVLEEV